MKKNQQGGYRPGSGRKPGAMTQANKEKQAARDFIRKKVSEALGEMIEAQIIHAKGTPYAMIRAKDGTFVRATDTKQLDIAVAAGGTMLKIYTQAPNTQAFVALTDRAFDKPMEHKQVEGEGGGPIELAWVGEKKER